MGVILSAAGALEWLAEVFNSRAADLTKPLESDASGPGEVMFLPYLGG
jgi:xylulokinase